MAAAIIVAREAFAPKKYLASTYATIVGLGVCAFMAMAAFYNLGRPQYIDHRWGTGSYVHNFDMRVYYPVAKYFDELGFDGLYLGSVAAYVDDDPSTTVESLAQTGLRDLKTHRMRRVSEVHFELKEVKERFSPERWEEFKKDMRYFRLNMGVRDYLGSMSDHGGNATPVWMSIAHLMFAKTAASNKTLFIAALLDPLLLLIAFVAIGRTFGVRTMLVSIVLFGANDFYMFGTNWGGATLRHDWMAYLALGICALRKHRWVIGGALLALAAMIRAFPAMALLVLVFPVLWFLWDRIRADRRVPKWKEILIAQRSVLRIALGATCSVFVLWLASSLILGFDSWVDWFHKVRLLHRDPHVNHVSLRGLIGGPDGAHTRLFQARAPIFAACVAFYVGSIALATRYRKLFQASALGLLLIPVLFHPANYYVHFVFLLPLATVELRRAASQDARPLSRGDALYWLVFLSVCAAQYWSAVERDLGLHFQFAAAIMLTGMGVALISILADDVRKGRFPFLQPPKAWELELSSDSGTTRATANVKLPTANDAGTTPEATQAPGQDESDTTPATPARSHDDRPQEEVKEEGADLPKA